MSQTLGPLLLCGALLAAAPAAQAAATRTHVSNAGNDANTAFSCDATHPCRTFAAALTQTTAGGEILAIDSSGYGKVTIDRSVSIIAAPGVFAGIGVGAGGNATGVEIGTSGVKVVLRGLTITGQGGTYGIQMFGGDALYLENCSVTGFASPSGVAVRVVTPALIRVVDSVIRDNEVGLWPSGGANLAVSRSTISGNRWGVYAHNTVAATTTRAVVSNSTVSGGQFGVSAVSNGAGASVVAALERTAVSNAATTGVLALAAAGSATIALSDSSITGNATGVSNGGGGGTTTVRSAGNNTITDNGSNTAGVISPFAPM